MNLTIAQLNPTVGAVAQNVQAMLAAIAQAAQAGADFVVFPEMAVSGYPPKDLLTLPDFVDECLAANTSLAAASQQYGIGVIWGNIAKNTTSIGKPLHNAAYVAMDGKIVAQAGKCHLPTYDVFDEARHFEPVPPGQAVATFTWQDQCLALCICEDLWSHPCFSLQEKAAITPVQYGSTPLAVLNQQPVSVLFNLSASPYVLGKPTLRHTLLKRLADAQNVIVVFANQVGGNDDLVFDGSSCITWPNQAQVALPGFTTALQTVPLLHPPSAPEEPCPEAWEAELMAALVLGIRDYMHKSGFQKVFLGLSGGIDSSLVAVLATKALGRENVIGIAMPGPYSSTHSLEDAQALAENLGIDFRVHSINEPFASYLNLLSGGQRQMDVAEQNLQARLRGIILMTLSNRENGLVLTTGNKSELATGYSTLYGDSCGALAPLGDVYKTQVYALCHHINTQGTTATIPQRVLDKPPSAELAPDQKDSDTLPPYPVLDKILTAILEQNLGFGDLRRLGYDENNILQTLKRVMGYEFKRQQMPPTLKVSSKAFGSGRVYPIVQRTQLPSIIPLTSTTTS